MSPQEELDWISQYMKERHLQGRGLGPPFFSDGLIALSGPGHDQSSPGPLFQDWRSTSHCSQLCLEGALAEELGPLLTYWCQQWLSHGMIPLGWRRGWVVLLPKPNKPPTEPKALRPIALQTPLSKTVMSLFAHSAKLHALPGLIWYLQFAYLPGRGTWEAITRVTAHVREVQTLLARWKYDANSTVRGDSGRPKVYGGCQLFLDLTGLLMPCHVNTSWKHSAC